MTELLELGRRAYELAARSVPWPDVAGELDLQGADRADRARKAAKRHALREGLPWPLNGTTPAAAASSSDCACGRPLRHRMEARCEPCKLDELRAGAHSLPDRGRRITVTYRRRADRSVEILGVDTHGWTIPKAAPEPPRLTGRAATIADAAVREHEPRVRRIVQRFYAPGYDQDDLMQVGRMAVLAALRSYEPGRGSLAALVNLAIERALASTVKGALRGKQHPHAARLQQPIGEDAAELGDLVADPYARDPADVVEADEELDRLVDAAADLTSLERAAIGGVLNGTTYGDVAAEHGVNEKAIDNARQRGTKKLRRAVNEEDSVPAPPHREWRKAARLVLNEGQSMLATAKQLGMSDKAVANAVWRYYAEQDIGPLPPADFREQLRMIGLDDGATGEQNEKGNVLVTYPGGRQDRYACLDHYAAMRRNLQRGREKGSLAGGVKRAEKAAAIRPAGTRALPAPGQGREKTMHDAVAEAITAGERVGDAIARLCAEFGVSRAALEQAYYSYRRKQRPNQSRVHEPDSGTGATPAGGTTEETPAATDPAPSTTTDAPDSEESAAPVADPSPTHEGKGDTPGEHVDADPASGMAPVSAPADPPQEAVAEDPSVALASTAAPTSWGADDPASWITPDDLQRHVATIDQADELAEAQSRLIAAEGDLADVQHQADFWKSRYEDAVRRLDVANAALAHRNGHSAGPTPREHALWMALVLLRAAIVEHSYTSAVKPLVDAAMETAGAPS